MKTEYFKFLNTRFYLEPNCDFDENGNIKQIGGYWAGLIKDSHELSGRLFETRERAMQAMMDFASALMHADA